MAEHEVRAVGHVGLDLACYGAEAARVLLWVPVTYLAVWELTRILLPSCMMPGIGHATLDLTDLVLGAMLWPT